MGECWYCYWGWAKKVQDIYDRAVEMLDGNSNPLHFGPAHVVWEDENWDSAKWCIENFDKYSKDMTEIEKEVVMWSLIELEKIPLKERDPEPQEYKDLDDREQISPEDYPPPKHIEMAREEIPDREL